MSEKDYDKQDMIKVMGEGFIAGYQFAVEVAVHLEKDIEKKFLAKHKKVLNNFIEDLKITAATIDRELIKEVAENYLKEQVIKKELAANTPKPVIHKPSLSQVKRYNIQKGVKK